MLSQLKYFLFVVLVFPTTLVHAEGGHMGPQTSGLSVDVKVDRLVNQVDAENATLTCIDRLAKDIANQFGLGRLCHPPLEGSRGSLGPQRLSPYSKKFLISAYVSYNEFRKQGSCEETPNNLALSNLSPEVSDSKESFYGWINIEKSGVAFFGAPEIPTRPEQAYTPMALPVIAYTQYVKEKDYDRFRNVEAKNIFLQNIKILYPKSYASNHFLHLINKDFLQSLGAKVDLEKYSECLRSEIVSGHGK